MLTFDGWRNVEFSSLGGFKKADNEVSKFFLRRGTTAEFSEERDASENHLALITPGPANINPTGKEGYCIVASNRRN